MKEDRLAVGCGVGWGTERGPSVVWHTCVGMDGRRSTDRTILYCMCVYITSFITYRQWPDTVVVYLSVCLSVKPLESQSIHPTSPTHDGRNPLPSLSVCLTASAP